MNNQERVRCHQLSFENPDTAVTVISSIFGGFPHYMDVLSSIFQALFDDALWSGVCTKRSRPNFQYQHQAWEIWHGTKVHRKCISTSTRLFALLFTILIASWSSSYSRFKRQCGNSSHLIFILEKTSNTRGGVENFSVVHISASKTSYYLNLND